MALSPEAERFYFRWLGKASLYSQPTLEAAYDKFFTLYVLFNRFYQEATLRLAATDPTMPTRIYEVDAATQHVVRYLGPVFWTESYTRMQELAWPYDQSRT
jgi:hypothetical protein